MVTSVEVMESGETRPPEVSTVWLDQEAAVSRAESVRGGLVESAAIFAMDWFAIYQERPNTVDVRQSPRFLPDDDQPPSLTSALTALGPLVIPLFAGNWEEEGTGDWKGSPAAVWAVTALSIGVPTAGPIRSLDYLDPETDLPLGFELEYELLDSSDSYYVLVDYETQFVVRIEIPPDFFDSASLEKLVR